MIGGENVCWYSCYNKLVYICGITKQSLKPVILEHCTVCMHIIIIVQVIAKCSGHVHIFKLQYTVYRARNPAGISSRLLCKHWLTKLRNNYSSKEYDSWKC